MNQVTAMIFRDGRIIERVPLDAAMPQEGESAFIWIEILNPLDSDFAVLQERFGLHSLAVDDSMSPAKLPKLDVYDDQLFAVLKIARLQRSEERRVGKECRSRWSAYQSKKKEHVRS